MRDFFFQEVSNTLSREKNCRKAAHKVTHALCKHYVWVLFNYCTILAQWVKVVRHRAPTRNAHPHVARGHKINERFPAQTYYGHKFNSKVWLKILSGQTYSAWPFISVPKSPMNYKLGNESETENSEGHIIYQVSSFFLPILLKVMSNVFYILSV